jgi:glycosyltransferase involved in cell wall biosynthesis
MQIVIVSINGIGNSGGVERVSFYLYKILKKYFSVRILTRTKVSFGRLDAVMQPLFMTLRLCLIRNKIVISNSWQSFFYPADLSIHHGTTLGFTRKTQITSTFGSKIISFMEKISCVSSKRIIAVSRNARNELIALYGADENRIEVINNFVDENIFYPVMPPGSPAEHTNNIIVILFSGRLGTRKGLDVLKSLSNFLETIEGFELHIACNDSSNIAYFEQNKKTKIIVGLDTEQMRTFYNSGDILFFPTLYEGFPMSTLEALCCGIPVIGTEFAIMEEIRHFECAKIYDSLNIEVLLEQMAFMVEKYRSKRNEIHEMVKKEFGYKQYEEKLLILLRKSNVI